MDDMLQSSFVVPETVVSHFNIIEGDTIADFGAGSGFFLEALASRTKGGKVYACEIQKILVERIGEEARRRGLQNVFPLWCDLEEVNGIKLQTGAVDIGILVNTLFQLEDKEAAVMEMGRVIRQGGKFFVIDWTDSFGGAGPHFDRVVSREEVVALYERNGFVLDRDFPAGAHHYGLAFRKI